MKDKLIAALLALFFGGFGVHHFYLGNKKRGVIYLVLFWTGIPFLIGFIEGILLLVKEQSEFDAQYNNGLTQSSYKQGTAEALEKLYDLKQKGVLTEDEFQQQKAKLL